MLSFEKLLNGHTFDTRIYLLFAKFSLHFIYSRGIPYAQKTIMVSTENITSRILGRILALSFLITRGSTCSVDDEVPLELQNTCKLPCKPNNGNESSFFVKWYKSAGNGDDCYYQDANQEPTIATLTATKLTVKDGYRMDENDFSLTIVQGSEEDIGLFRCTITTITYESYNYDVKTKLKRTLDEGSNTVPTLATEDAYTSRDPHAQLGLRTTLAPDNSSLGKELGFGFAICISIVIVIVIVTFVILYCLKNQKTKAQAVSSEQQRMEVKSPLDLEAYMICENIKVNDRNLSNREQNAASETDGNLKLLFSHPGC